MIPSQLEVHPELNEDCADTKGNLIMKKECDVINWKGQVKHPLQNVGYPGEKVYTGYIDYF